MSGAGVLPPFLLGVPRRMNAENQPIIWLIDNNHWERADIRALLIELGFQVEGFVDIRHSLSLFHREIVEKPDLIILELHGLVFKESELDKLSRLEAPVILLTGVFEDDRQPLVKYKWSAVLRRPFSIGQLAELVLVHAAGKSY
jgi:hypothetical protein